MLNRGACQTAIASHQPHVASGSDIRQVIGSDPDRGEIQGGFLAVGDDVSVSLSQIR